MVNVVSLTSRISALDRAGGGLDGRRYPRRWRRLTLSFDPGGRGGRDDLAGVNPVGAFGRQLGLRFDDGAAGVWRRGGVRFVPAADQWVRGDRARDENGPSSCGHGRYYSVLSSAAQGAAGRIR